MVHHDRLNGSQASIGNPREVPLRGKSIGRTSATTMEFRSSFANYKTQNQTD